MRIEPPPSPACAIRGGENVYPAEIETVLAEHPGVRECMVLGVPHPEPGQEVAAVVVTEADTDLTEESLRAHVAQELACFKVPRRWRLTTDSLPRNATGKVLRRACTALNRCRACEGRCPAREFSPRRAFA